MTVLLDYVRSKPPGFTDQASGFRRLQIRMNQAGTCDTTIGSSQFYSDVTVGTQTLKQKNLQQLPTEPFEGPGPAERSRMFQEHSSLRTRRHSLFKPDLIPPARSRPPSRLPAQTVQSPQKYSAERSSQVSSGQRLVHFHVQVTRPPQGAGGQTRTGLKEPEEAVQIQERMLERSADLWGGRRDL
ncbi:hypothetical protein FQA47_013206 [Oryzias melastigma]|uniref:Uncharacterized protein n=1 Tax=Oryzias melastigma TaxID=30732 RepID=A0A834KWJ1_ORYME|nr:hypothetical protein FQA47_013206 [Oryzias melastigma]